MNKKKIISFLTVTFLIIFELYTNEINPTYSKPTTGTLEVQFIDVGQADAILIKNDTESMLIDAGNNEDGELLSTYLKENNITNLKYLVGTHPHEDHIGGLDNIINDFNIETIYLPDAITTTKTFTEVLDAIENKNMEFTVPTIGETFKLNDATLEVLYTGTDTSDLNNTSIVLRLDFGETSFLFTGDATEKTEELILNKNIDVDVLKVGHHGSRYSSTDKFLTKTSPEYAIISVGTQNTYKHPHTETLNKLDNSNIKTHRTDKEGTIIITSDGTNINITNKKTNTNG